MTQASDLYSILIKTHMLLDDSDTYLLQQYNLGNTRYYALLHLRETPGLTQNELSDRLLCTKGNTTRIVKTLERDGYLTRQVDAADNRALRLYLTAAGAALLQQAHVAYEELNELRFACLDAMECANLQHNLEALNAHLETLLAQYKGPQSEVAEDANA